MIEHFKNLGLSERDFDLIIDGLNGLPNRSPMGDAIGEALSKAMNSRGEGFQVLELNMEDLRKRSELSRKDLTEEVTILQGKLLQLKRALRAENILSKVDDILDLKGDPKTDKGDD